MSAMRPTGRHIRRFGFFPFACLLTGGSFSFLWSIFQFILNPYHIIFLFQYSWSLGCLGILCYVLGWTSPLRMHVGYPSVIFPSMIFPLPFLVPSYLTIFIEIIENKPDIFKIMVLIYEGLNMNCLCFSGLLNFSKEGTDPYDQLSSSLLPLTIGLNPLSISQYGII